jgi:hypothetical protein
MISEQITFDSRGNELSGTLHKPSAAGQFPTFIAVHGASNGTRDHVLYTHLVKILCRRGFAVFLYDRSGSGRSEGDSASASFVDLAMDLLAATEELRIRLDLDSQRIGLWGLSQGGWIAPLAASMEDWFSSIIVVSGTPLTPADQMIYSVEFALRNDGYSQAEQNVAIDLCHKVNEYYRGKLEREPLQDVINDARKQSWFSATYLDNLLPPDPKSTKWYLEMDFDPTSSIRNLKVPMLVLLGALDRWIPVEESINLWMDLAQGNGDFTSRILPNCNHYMMEFASEFDETGSSISEDYENELVAWLENRI